MTNEILLRNIRFYAYHGVLPQERIVGAYFLCNLTLQTDFSKAMLTDDLAGTISYADVYEVVKAEMAQPSATLEHVAYRILKALFAAFPTLQAVHIELFKEHPPMAADNLMAGVSIKLRRGEWEMS